jgi:hypothetical protein
VNNLEITSRDLSGNRSDTVALSVEVIPANQRDADIVGLWHMDGNWYDYSESINHFISNSGVKFSTDLIGGTAAGSFDGLNGYVMKNPINNFPQTAITVDFWMKTSNILKEGAIITYAVTNSDNEFRVVDPRNISISRGTEYVVTGISVNDGKWHHIAVTWQSLNGEVKLYKDGALVFTGTLAVGKPISQGGSLVFGQEQDAVGGAFDVSQAYEGIIDEVVIYKRALRADEVFKSVNSIPKITITRLGQTQFYRPGEAGTAIVAVTDDVGIRGISCKASGAATGTLSVSFASGQPTATQDLTFQVAANAAPYAPIPITCTAYDDDGNVGTGNMTLTVSDIVQPTVVSTSIQDYAADIPATSPITVTFSEALASSSATTANIVLTKDNGSGQTAAVTIALSTDKKSITLTPTSALARLTAYKLTVS